MSTQPLNHLQIIENRSADSIDFESAQSILKSLSSQILEAESEMKDIQLPVYPAYVILVISMALGLYVSYFWEKNSSLSWLLSIFSTSLSLYGFFVLNYYPKLIVVRREIRVKNKKGEYFSVILPLSRDLLSLQEAVNASHALINSPEITPWQKVDLGIQIRAAEKALITGREILQKYDPSLLPQ